MCASQIQTHGISAREKIRTKFKRVQSPPPPSQPRHDFSVIRACVSSVGHFSRYGHCKCVSLCALYGCILVRVCLCIYLTKIIKILRILLHPKIAKFNFQYSFYLSCVYHYQVIKLRQFSTMYLVFVLLLLFLYHFFSSFVVLRICSLHTISLTTTTTNNNGSEDAGVARQ